MLWVTAMSPISRRFKVELFYTANLFRFLRLVRGGAAR